MGLAAAGNDAVVVYGGFTSTAGYASRVDRIPLTIQGMSVTAGTPVTMLSSADQCTGISYAVADGTHLLLVVTDLNGERLLQVAP